MEGDLPRNHPRLRGNPTREEVDRIVDDIMGPFKAKHAPPPLTDTEKAVVKAKTIGKRIVAEVRAELGNTAFVESHWQPRLMEAFRSNFHTHFSHDELVELLAVMHTEFAIELLR